MVESGKFINKHGVAKLLNERWQNQIKWIQCVCERVVALSISVNKQPITLVSVYMPHSGYPDHSIEENLQNNPFDDWKRKLHEDHWRRFPR